jgi:nucleotide-binding universal stress UspA family protein
MQSAVMDNMGPVQPSINANWSKPSAEHARPVAQSRGANWAWERPQRTQTAVVRSIHMRCQLDRWVILPERASKAAPVVIELDGTPEQRAEQLAQAVKKRVESWGVALASGHWSPVLQVEVAPDADWRFEQLRRLMEGSGISVVRKEFQAPNQ